jgi:hypothetical protein
MVADADQWDQWWSNYTAFLLHYARIAEQQQADAFCLGCEMNSTEAQVARWRELIGKVREIYQGPLTYNVNHDRCDEVEWWDAVDLIGVSAYYPAELPDDQPVEEAVQATTSVAEISAALESVRTDLAALSRQWQKPIFFIETGVTNVRGAARSPWAPFDACGGRPVDQQEQANYYQAMFEVFWDEPWFMGYAWWDWPARLYDVETAAEHRGFCIYGKQGEEVLRQWYAKPREAPTPP